MLLLLIACSSPASQSGSVASGADVTGAPDYTTVFSEESTVGDPQLYEVDNTGAVTWQLDVPSALGSHWAADHGNPMLMDVQPVKGGTFILAIYGTGLFEVDHSGQIVWELDDPMASHDVDRLPNGDTLYTRTWAPQGADAVVEVDSSGKQVWAWSGEAAFGSDSRFNGYVDEGGAWMHPNAVQRLADGTTSVCVRNFNEVAIVDSSGNVVKEVTFQTPDGADGPKNTGTLLGQRPHSAQWVPGQGFSVALRSPDRAFVIKDSTLQHEFRSPDVSGITDYDQFSDGTAELAAHDRVEEVDASGAVVWSWVVPSVDVGPDDRARHTFQTISRIDDDGAPVDFD